MNRKSVHQSNVAPMLDKNVKLIPVESNHLTPKTMYKKETTYLRNVTNKINSLAGPHWTDLEKVMCEYDRLTQQSIPPDVFVFSSLFKACAERVPPAVGTAIGIWEDMLNYGIKPNTVVFNSIINVFASNADLKEAEYFYELMDQFNVTPDVQTFNSLINACSSAEKNSLERADYWFNKLVEKKLKPDEHTFNTLIATAANSQNADKGFEFFKMMEQYKVYSNVQTLTTVLKLCAQSLRLDKALQIFEAAEASLEPDTLMWNSLLNVCAKTGNCEVGFKLWDQMCKHSKTRPDAASINAILDLCGQKGHFDKLCDVLAEAEVLGITLNEYSLPTLINGCVKSGNATNAFNWFNLFKQMMPCNKIALCNLFRVLSTDKAFQKISITLFKEALEIGIFNEHVLKDDGTLLLTGLPTMVARISLLYALQDMHRRYVRGDFLPVLVEVITGRGKMKNYCLGLAEELGIEFQCKKNNIGRLIIPPRSLREYCLRQSHNQ